MGKYLCMKTDCVHAGECERLQAFLRGEVREEIIEVVNPALVGDGTHCPHGARRQMVAFARGFQRACDRLSQKTLREVSLALSLIYGRNPYYKMRRGDRLISPEDQSVILSVFRKNGIADTDIFDSFEEQEQWQQI